jgi:lysozyme
MSELTIGLAGINLIKKNEGCKLTSYLCPAKVWTIGYGSTYYADGTKVKAGDKICQETANELFLEILRGFVHVVDKLVTSKVTQNQFDAMVSLAYNIGLGGFKKSSVLRKVNINPNDPTIGDSFKLWNKGGGKVLKGLVNRRAEEVELYFKD